MVAVSNVPGRLRLKNPALLGQPVLCRRVEIAVREVSGVWHAEASHRTGTLLLVHDVEPAASDQLIEAVRRSLVACGTTLPPPMAPTPADGERAALREATRELAWHGLRMMLPPPWGTLLPVVPIARRLLTAGLTAASRNGNRHNGHAHGPR